MDRVAMTAFLDASLSPKQYNGQTDTEGLGSFNPHDQHRSTALRIEYRRQSPLVTEENAGELIQSGNQALARWPCQRASGYRLPI